MSTLPARQSSQEDTRLDSVRPRMARIEPTVTASHTPFRRVIEAVIKAQGNVKAAAAEMEIDRAQLHRQMENGHLTVEKLESLDAAFYVALAKELLDEYGPLVTPIARARQKVREMRAALEEIDQVLEYIA